MIRDMRLLFSINKLTSYRFTIYPVDAPIYLFIKYARSERIPESTSIFKAQPLCKLARDKRSNDSERLLPMELYDFRNRLRYWILISFSDKTIIC